MIQFQRSLHFIESSQRDVKKKDVYVNASAATDGAILKVGGLLPSYRRIWRMATMIEKDGSV